MEHNNPFLESMLKLSKIHVLYSQTSNDGSQSNNPFLERHTFNDENYSFGHRMCQKPTYSHIYARKTLQCRK